MAGIKISGLQNAGPLSGEERIVLVQPNTPPRSNVQESLNSTFNQLAPVSSVNLKTGAVTLTASDVGALAPGSNISELVNDVGYITGGSQPAGFVYAGPTSGPNASPGFRALVASDIPALPYLTSNQTITLSGAVTGSGTTAITTTLANNIVTNEKLRDSAALSVIGRSTNSSGDPADISASSDGQILRRSGTSLGFGTIGIGSITMSTNRLLGRTTASSGAVEEIQVQNALTFSGGIFRWGGSMNQNTVITGSGNNLSFTGMGDIIFNTSTDSIQFTVNTIPTGSLSLSNGLVSTSVLGGNGLQQWVVSTNGMQWAHNGSSVVNSSAYYNGSGLLTPVPHGTDGQVYTMVSGVPTWTTLPTGSGSVTGFSAGNLSGLFTTNVATSTTTPALTFSPVSQSANTFFAAPSGSAGNPSFRTITQLDQPRNSREESSTDYTIQQSDLGYIIYMTTGGIVRLPNGFSTNFEVAIVRAPGAGLVTILAQGILFSLDSANTLEFAGAGAMFTHKGSNTWFGFGSLGAAISASGTVTNFFSGNLSPLFTVNVTTATTTPSITFSQISQSGNLVYASPDGSSGAPVFRSLTDFDLPNFRIEPSGVAQYTLTAQDNMRIVYLTNVSGTDVRINAGLGTGFSVLIWRSTNAGPVTFSTGVGVTYEGAGQVMEFAKTSVMLVNSGSDNYIAAGAIGAISSGGGSGEKHIIKQVGSVFSERDNLNFYNGFTVSNSGSDTEVRLGSTLNQSITWDGNAGQYGITASGLSQFTASTQNSNQLILNSSQASLSTGTAGAITVTSAGVISLLNLNNNRSLIIDDNGMILTLGSDATGDIYYRNSSGRFTRLAAVGTGNALISQGTTTAPAYGKIGLTTHVSGALPIANGGTSITTYAQGDLIYSNATNSLSKLTKGAQNTILGMNNSGTVQEYKTVGSGLTAGSGTLRLGGNLLANASINTNGFALEFGTFATNRSRYHQTNDAILVSSGGAAAAALFVQSGSGLYIANMGYIHSGGGLSSQIQISSTEMLVADSFNSKGLVYAADYSSNFVTRSIPDVGYVLGTKTYTGKQTFTPTASVAGINVGATTANPSSPVNGDIYYNSSAGELRARINGAWVALGAGGGGVGTVTSVGITAPASGITVSGSPITSSGNITLALNNDLLALENLSSTGFAVRTASNTWAQRTITNGTGISVSNGNGVSGNPTISLSHLGIQSLTGPGADRIMFWDQSNGATGWLSLGTNLSISGTTLNAAGGGGGSGTVTSVQVSGGSTGLSFSGGPITTSGTMTMSGTLGIANGGTGLSSVGANGTVLRSNGSSLSYYALTSGTYTPTITPVTGIDSYTGFISTYTRTGDVVTVYGRITVNIDGASNDSGILKISLPVSSAFNNISNCNGVVTSLTNHGLVGVVQASPADDLAHLSFDNVQDASHEHMLFYVFQYQVL